MAIAQSRKVELSEIPVVDIGLLEGSGRDRRRLGDDLREACESVGFFYVANHGVAAEATASIFSQAHRFFGLPMEERRALAITRSPVYRGYLAVGERGANLNRPADILESLNLGRDLGPDHPDVEAGTPLHGPNQWPTSLPGFREQVTAYQQTMLGLADRILQALALALDVPFAWLQPQFSPPLTQMRLLHYAPQPPEIDNMTGARPHQDTSFFTILLQDDVGGLEIQARNGEWLAAPPRPDMFVVNAGEFLELATSGCFCSALHRVVNRTSRQRFSVPFFVSPGYSTILSPLPQFASRRAPAISSPSISATRWPPFSAACGRALLQAPLRGRKEKTWTRSPAALSSSARSRFWTLPTPSAAQPSGPGCSATWTRPARGSASSTSRITACRPRRSTTSSGRHTVSSLCPKPSAKPSASPTHPGTGGYLPTGAPGANKVTRNNLLEAFNLARELGPEHSDVVALKPLHGPNQWPAEQSLPGFRKAVLAYYGLMEDLSRRVLTVLCGAMDIAPQSLLPEFDNQLAQLRLLYYPAQPVQDDPLLGVRAHHDTSFLTMLVQDDAGGLEVQDRSGEWLVVPPRPDMFVVNVGSYLECLSSGVYTAAKHRVVNRSGRRRYSIPFFFSPRFEVTVEPLPHFSSRPGAKKLAPMHVGEDMVRFFDTLFPAVADRGGGPHDKHKTASHRVIHKMAEGYEAT